MSDVRAAQLSGIHELEKKAITSAGTAKSAPAMLATLGACSMGGREVSQATMTRMTAPIVSGTEIVDHVGSWQVSKMKPQGDATIDATPRSVAKAWSRSSNMVSNRIGHTPDRQQGPPWM